MAAPKCGRCGQAREKHLQGPDGSLVCPSLSTYRPETERPRPGTAQGDMRFDSRVEPPRDR